WRDDAARVSLPQVEVAIGLPNDELSVGGHGDDFALRAVTRAQRCRVALDPVLNGLADEAHRGTLWMWSLPSLPRASWRFASFAYSISLWRRSRSSRRVSISARHSFVVRRFTAVSYASST